MTASDLKQTAAALEAMADQLRRWAAALEPPPGAQSAPPPTQSGYMAAYWRKKQDET